MPNEEIDRLPPPDAQGRIVLTQSAKWRATLVRLLVILSCSDVAGIIVCVVLPVPLAIVIAFAVAVVFLLVWVGLPLIIPDKLIIDDNTITMIQAGIRRRMEIKDIKIINVREVFPKNPVSKRTFIDIFGRGPEYLFRGPFTINAAVFDIKPSAIADLLYQRTGLEQPADDQARDSAASPVLSARSAPTTRRGSRSQFADDIGAKRLSASFWLS